VQWFALWWHEMSFYGCTESQALVLCCSHVGMGGTAARRQSALFCMKIFHQLTNWSGFAPSDCNAACFREETGSRNRKLDRNVNQKILQIFLLKVWVLRPLLTCFWGHTVRVPVAFSILLPLVWFEIWLPTL